MRYEPRRAIPTPEDRAAGAAAVSRIARIRGAVFVPHHGYLAILAGKRNSAHTVAMDDIFLEDAAGAGRDLENEMLGALRERRFAAVVIESDGRYASEIEPYYGTCEALFERGDVFWPVAGAHLRPEVLCTPRPEAASAPREAR